MAKSNIGIIGGGIIGRSCAFKLQQSGFNTTIFDQSTPPLIAPSWNNAGHIATEQICPLASYSSILSAPKRLFHLGGALDFRLFESGVLPWMLKYIHASSPQKYALGKQALSSLVNIADSEWRQLTDELECPALFQPNGHWVVWESEVSALKSSRLWQKTDTGQAQFYPLVNNKQSKLLDHLDAKLAAGIEFSGTGQITNLKMLSQRLEQRFLSLGGTCIASKVSPLIKNGNRALIETEDKQQYEFDQIIVCAGISSADILRYIHPSIPLIAERGYHLEAKVDEKDWPTDLPPIVFEDRSMIVTRFSDTLRACSFVEFSAIKSKPDTKKWQYLLRNCQQLGLPIDENASKWSGARPTLPDYLPAIGKSDKVSNLVYAFGHQHLGLTLAPVTAQLVKQLLVKGKTHINLAPFALDRF